MSFTMRKPNGDVGVVSFTMRKSYGMWLENAVSKTGMCMGEVMGKAMRMSVGEAGFALANSFSPCESHGGSHDVERVRMRIAWQTPCGKLSESFIWTI